jgi:zinc protease
MTAEDFERTRKFLRGYMKLYIQSASSRLGYLMDSRFYGREDYIGEMDKLLSELTLEKVNATIKQHLQADNWYVAVITDDSEAEKLAEAIRTNAGAPIVYKPSVSAELPQEVKDEDALVDAYQLKDPKARVVKNTEMFQ